MSVFVRCYAAVGVKIDKNKLYKSRAVRGCVHSLPWTITGKHCAQCGKLLWVGEDVLIDGYDEVKETLCGFKVLLANGGSRSNDAIICNQLIEAGDPLEGGWVTAVLPLAMTAINGHVMSNMQVVLEPLGLWDPSQYGIWVIGRAG